MIRDTLRVKEFENSYIVISEVACQKAKDLGYDNPVFIEENINCLDDHSFEHSLLLYPGVANRGFLEQIECNGGPLYRKLLFRMDKLFRGVRSMETKDAADKYVKSVKTPPLLLFTSDGAFFLNGILQPSVPGLSTRNTGAATDEEGYYKNDDVHTSPVAARIENFDDQMSGKKRDREVEKMSVDSDEECTGPDNYLKKLSAVSEDLDLHLSFWHLAALNITNLEDGTHREQLKTHAQSSAFKEFKEKYKSGERSAMTMIRDACQIGAQWMCAKMLASDLSVIAAAPKQLATISVDEVSRYLFFLSPLPYTNCCNLFLLKGR